MLEKMDDFFNRRLEGYEEHQLQAIDQAQTFYPLTAACLPKEEAARILNLGCGTGLELSYYFELNPTAGDFYHYNTPLTVEHEIQALEQTGFSHAEVLGRWSNTCLLKAVKTTSV